jgi:aryl-alcohol dehydrogenase-like predicted oxidoreductase
MVYNQFSKSEIKISLLGYGAWGIGGSMWIGAKDSESKLVLRRAIEEGINFFDSALVYGNGHSEQLLGQVEKESGQTLFITSKMPPKNHQWPAKDNSSLQDAFPKEWIIKSTEKSLKNLNREYLDLQQFHAWSDNWANKDEWKEAILQLKKEGKVRFFGISVNDHQANNGIEAGKSGFIDSYQVIFNIFDQSPVDQLFPFCRANNISIIARVPFDEGALTGNIKPDTEFPPNDFRNNYFRADRKKEIWQRVQNICSDIHVEISSLSEIALRFIISHDSVTSVIPGIRKMKHLKENLASIAKGPLTKEIQKKLKKHSWQKNFYQ